MIIKSSQTYVYIDSLAKAFFDEHTHLIAVDENEDKEQNNTSDWINCTSSYEDLLTEGQKDLMTQMRNCKLNLLHKKRQSTPLDKETLSQSTYEYRVFSSGSSTK